jgi:flagella basal body P-ring formation protein FlgA
MLRLLCSILVFTCICLDMASADDTAWMPVPARPVLPGQSLARVEFVPKLFAVSAISRQNFVFRAEQFEHMEATVVLAAGKPVAIRTLRRVEDVKKGQLTKAVYSIGTIDIEGLLLPLSGGSAGQIIDARNTTSHEIVRAEVLSDGSLRVVRR